MSMPTGAVAAEATAQALTALALGRTAAELERAEDLRGMFLESSGLDPRSFALVKIAALVAVDAPPASYLWQVGEALAGRGHATGHPGRPDGDRAPGSASRGWSRPLRRSWSRSTLNCQTG